ncbi:type II 3-dehydroquinate dehydratase [Mangrovibacterium marinum]|uniref:3-dehydroquinate dehydratase n=1 Tax=Mangrovibacterium marinum TaxID=1639118 RepID=A0A2T5BY97_9BACT|nr:type II 3-dehydroquinate dehydratase [Mangrovibacterium marinum]PTN06752.1 3-dehydroquinate dehydratase [Mangrovibacterium marinum]
MKILLMNGPNLNLLGKRERGIYGDTCFETYYKELVSRYPHIELEYYQSNIEGELIDKIHAVGYNYDGIVFNAGAYTHTSVAIRDAIAGVTTPVVEVHISNTLTRENFRHESIIGPVCRGSIMGFGLDSYRLGIESFIKN